MRHLLHLAGPSPLERSGLPSDSIRRLAACLWKGADLGRLQLMPRLGGRSGGQYAASSGVVAAVIGAAARRGGRSEQPVDGVVLDRDREMGAQGAGEFVAEIAL